MSDAVKIGFVPFSTAPRGTVIVFTDETMKLGQRTAKALGSAADSIKRAAAAAKFKGKSRSALEILAPAGLKADCLLDRKSTRLNSSHANISYAVFCLKKKKKKNKQTLE